MASMGITFIFWSGEVDDDRGRINLLLSQLTIAVTVLSWKVIDIISYKTKLLSLFWYSISENH